MRSQPSRTCNTDEARLERCPSAFANEDSERLLEPASVDDSDGLVLSLVVGVLVELSVASPVCVDEPEEGSVGTAADGDELGVVSGEFVGDADESDVEADPSVGEADPSEAVADVSLEGVATIAELSVEPIGELVPSPLGVALMSLGDDDEAAFVAEEPVLEVSPVDTVELTMLAELTTDDEGLPGRPGNCKQPSARFRLTYLWISKSLRSNALK